VLLSHLNLCAAQLASSNSHRHEWLAYLAEPDVVYKMAWIRLMIHQDHSGESRLKNWAAICSTSNVRQVLELTWFAAHPKTSAAEANICAQSLIRLLNVEDSWMLINSLPKVLLHQVCLLHPKFYRSYAKYLEHVAHDCHAEHQSKEQEKSNL
jgi:hypothetical protein